MDEPISARIEGRSEVVAAWRDLLLSCADSAVREIRCVDPDFEHWPLDEPAVLDALVRWARPPGRLFQMLGADFAGLARRQPRFSNWRRDWAHRFEARSPGEHERMDLPSVLLVGGQGIELLDREHWRARRVTAPADLRPLVEAIDAMAQRCEAAWPSTTLGL